MSNRIEAQIVFENDGYDDIPSLLEAYDALAEHIGFEDKRRDKRFIVKFHGIYDYAPQLTPQQQAGYDANFDLFCSDTYDDVMMALEDTPFHGVDSLLSTRYVGNYRTFIVDMPEITSDNIISLAEQFYDEFDYDAADAVTTQIAAITVLQDLEDTYMEQWIEYLTINDFNPQIIKQIKENYDNSRHNP